MGEGPAAEAVVRKDSGEKTVLKLGRYEVVRELGKGAMGIVYLAKDPLIGRLVPLKTICPAAPPPSAPPPPRAPTNPPSPRSASPARPGPPGSSTIPPS